MSFYSERLAEFSALSSLDMFGTALSKNGISVVCIRTPSSKSLDMTPGPYVESISSTFDILRSNWVLLKLGDKVDFECEEQKWQVVNHKDDPREPTIQFYAKKQM